MQLFRGLEEDDISALLSWLNSVKRNYKKGEIIFSEGSIIENIGIVLSGMAMISCNDIWGNTSILGSVAPGSVFAEVYACIPGQPMLVTVSAVEDTSVLFMNVGRVLTTCTNACPFHTNLARNLLTVCAHKSLQLSQRILHTSSKSIRGRLMSYFSECAKHAGSNSFLIPYNRQQLADYLNVDRSTMCNELSKMQKDGMIEYKKNRILLKDWDLRNGMNLNRDWFFKQNRLWSEIEYSAIIHSYRASVINTDNKMITLVCIGRIIWINQIIKRTVNMTENNL